MVWARLARGALMTLPFALRIAGPKALWPDRPWYHTLRAAFLVAATFFFFLSLKWLPIADALAIFLGEEIADSAGGMIDFLPDLNGGAGSWLGISATSTDGVAADAGALYLLDGLAE